MKKILERLYDCFYKPKNYSSLNQRIENNHKRLIQSLKKKHRRIVLQIIDDKDQIRNMDSFDSFTQGVRFGLSLREELNLYELPSDEDDWES